MIELHTSRSEPGQTLRPLKRSSSGFTLIELVVVISVMIALSAVLIPSVGQLLARQDMQLVKEELLSAMDLAHTQAIASGASYTVAVSPGGSTYNGELIVREGQAGETCAVVAATGRIVRRIQLADLDSTLEAAQVQGEVTPRLIKTSVTLVAIVPQDFGTGRALCFKGDGSMRDSETNTPIANPDALAPGTGDVIIEFQQVEKDTPVGVLNHVLVSYNGVARTKY